MEKQKLILILPIIMFFQINVFSQSDIWENSIDSRGLLVDELHEILEFGHTTQDALNNIQLSKINWRSSTEYFLDSIDFGSNVVAYHFYDDNNMLESVITKVDGDLADEVFITYNAESGLLEQHRSRGFETSTQNLIGDRIFNYKYNSESLLEELEFLSFNSTGDQQSQLKYFYKYSQNGQLEKIDFFSIEYSEGDVYVGGYVYYYDELNRIIKVEQFSQTGELSSISIYTYNSIGKLDVIELESVTDNNLEGYTEEFEYDEEGKLKSLLRDFNDPGDLSILELFEYNEEFEADGVLFRPMLIYGIPMTYDIYTDGQITRRSLRQTDEDGNVVDNDISLDFDFFWSRNNTVSTSFVEKTAIQVFPNPITDKMNFLGLELEEDMNLNIYDVSGRLVRNESLLNGSQSVDISDIFSGFYFFTLKNENQTIYSGSFVK